MAGDLDELARWRPPDGEEALVAALERTVTFGRFRAQDVRSIMDACAP